MADPLSITASVVALAGLAASVSMKLFELYDTIGDVKSEISNLAQDVSSLSSTLEQVGEVVHKHEELIRDKAISLIANIMKRCEKTMDELQVTIDLVGKKRLYFKWLFRKAKTKEQKANIEGYKSSLNTIMTTVILAHLLEQPNQGLRNTPTRAVSSAAQRNIDILRGAIRTNTDVLQRIKRAGMNEKIEPQDKEEETAQKAFERDEEVLGSDAKGSEPPKWKRGAVPAPESNSIGIVMQDYNWESVLIRKYNQLGKEPAVAMTLEEVLPERLRSMRLKDSESSTKSGVRISPYGDAKQSEKPAEEVQVLLEEWTTSSTAAVKSVGTAQGQRKREKIPEIPTWIQERYVFVGSDVNNPEHWKPRNVNLSDEVKVLPHTVFAYERSDDGGMLLDYLSDEGGCWVWRYEDSRKREYFVGTKKIVQYFMKPSEHSTFQPDGSIKTVVSRQWVSKETLQQANYPFKEYGEGSYAIAARLTPAEVRDLHIASSVRTERLLRKISASHFEAKGGKPQHRKTCVALFTFDESETAVGDLPFKKGDVLELEDEYPANGTGWGMAHLNGKKGIIPLNYVRPQNH